MIMRRLIAFIAIIFALAATIGATTAHAHRYVSTPIVVLNHVDEDNRAIPVVVIIQRGEIDLGSGIIMPCGFHPVIVVEQTALVHPEPCAATEMLKEVAGHPWSAPIPLKPPRHA